MVAAAAAVASVVVAAAGRGGGGGGGGGGGVTAAVAIAFTPSDLMRFRLRYLNFLDCIFHYNLDIIFSLTSDISNLIYF